MLQLGAVPVRAQVCAAPPLLDFLRVGRPEGRMMEVVLTELGVAVREGGEGGRTARVFPFSRSDPASEYVEARAGRVPEPLSGLAGYLAGLDSGALVSDEPLLLALKKGGADDCRLMDAEARERIQSSKPDVLVESGLAADRDEALERLRDFAMQLSSSKVAAASGSPDMHVIQAIGSLDEIDRMSNAAGSRLREWYGLHFPELDNIADGAAGYARIVLAGRRDGLSEEAFRGAGFDDAKVQMLSVACGHSRGGEISDGDLAAVQGMARQVLGMHDLRRELEARVEDQMRAVAPNLSAILGASVGARILARAGSLKRLASMPSSTIQVIGAEKALFRALKTGSRPPKHGLLFQHPLVHAAPRWQRGKVARAVAAKAAIAARVDVYSEGSINSTLLERLNVRVGEIGKKYSEPPPPGEPEPRERGRGGAADDRPRGRGGAADDRPRGRGGAADDRPRGRGGAGPPGRRSRPADDRGRGGAGPPGRRSRPADDRGRGGAGPPGRRSRPADDRGRGGAGPPGRRSRPADDRGRGGAGPPGRRSRPADDRGRGGAGPPGRRSRPADDRGRGGAGPPGRRGGGGAKGRAGGGSRGRGKGGGRKRGGRSGGPP